MAADTFVSGSGIDVCRTRKKGVTGVVWAYPKAIRQFRPSSKHIYSV